MDGARVIKKATTEDQHAKIVRLVQYGLAELKIDDDGHVYDDRGTQ